ncbi:MAG: hypothetical protein HOV81_19485, partial [Kofleriaceae bacterium]|nr:hypothetical protein [Kofleriaceae bacterium]
MTKRHDTPPPDDAPILEMDAMDEAEWEQDHHTPVVEDEKLAALVKESGPRDATPTPTVGRTHTQGSLTAPNIVKRAPTTSTDLSGARGKMPPPTPVK